MEMMGLHKTYIQIKTTNIQMKIKAYLCMDLWNIRVRQKEIIRSTAKETIKTNGSINNDHPPIDSNTSLKQLDQINVIYHQSGLSL